MTDRLLRQNNAPATSEVHAAVPFVGRDAELAWLHQRLDAAGTGQPQLLLLIGEAGIGKTRLLREFETAARARGVEVCTGRGYDEFTVPFFPIAEALAARRRAMPAAVDSALGPHAAVVRAFASGGAGSTKARGAGGEDKLRLFLAVSRAVIELARAGPLMLVLDDLHWVDQASLELFAHLVFAVADSAGREPVPLLLVGSTRPVDPSLQLARILGRFQREAICHTLEIGGLEESQVQELIRGLGLAPASHRLVAAVQEATRGNPLFVREIVYQLMKRGAQAQGSMDCADALLTLPLPADVTAAIADRLRDLDGLGRAVLTRAAALGGDPFTLAVLRAVSGIDDATLIDVLDDATSQGLLTRSNGGYQFAHPLIRQVLYGELHTTTRQRCHADIAKALQRAGAGSADPPVVAIAHHLIAAGTEAAAADVLAAAQQAGDRAFASASWRDAARFYRAALGADDTVHRLTVRDRAKLHSLTGQAHFRDQDAGPCLEAFEHALSGFAACSDHRGFARALVGKTRAQLTLAAVAYGTLIDPDPLRQAADQVEAEDPALCALLWSEMAQVFWTARRTQEGEAAARRALATGQRFNYDYVCAEALRALWLVLSQNMQVREAFDSLDEARGHARRCGDQWLESHLAQREPLTLTWLGRLDDAEVRAGAATEYTRATHDWGDHSLTQGALTCVAVARGDFAAAEHYAAQSLMMRHRSGYPWAGPTALPALACAHVLRGRWAEAEAALDTLARPGEVFVEPGAPVLLSVYVYRLAVQAHADASDAGRAAVREHARGLATTSPAEANADVYALGVYGACLEIADLTGDPSLVPTAERSLALAAERGVVLATGWVFVIARALGVAATLLRDWPRAARWFNLAIEQATAMRARAELGRAQLDYARMLIARGRRRDQEGASALLARAAAIFGELGMSPLLAAARRFEARLAARPPQDAALSAREAAVLVRLGQGCTDAEIARELLLPAATVGRTVGRMLKRLHLASRADACARAAREPPAPTPPRPERPLRIIVFTDIQGSTDLYHRLGDDAARAAMRRHDAIVRACLTQHGGSQIKHTGDGVMASFASVTDAIDCAVSIQRQLADHNVRAPDGAIRVRIGINAGEPIAEDGQLFGTAVNAAARICGHAQPAQILVADVVRSLAEGKDIRFVDRGWVALRGLSERYRLYEVPW
jgi:class 3 adenylate cyclase/tetratricopeptide (TPR) repeat protein